MKTITINVPDNCEVKIVKKEEKKCKFKKGDVIVSKAGFIAIFEKLGDPKDNYPVYYSVLYSPEGGFFFFILIKLIWVLDIKIIVD
jgi:hypothetical protein